MANADKIYPFEDTLGRRTLKKFHNINTAKIILFASASGINVVVIMKPDITSDAALYFVFMFETHTEPIRQKFTLKPF